MTAGSRPRLRPLSLGEILDVSIKICVANWRTLLRVVLIVVVPVEMVSSVLSADSTASQFDFSTNADQTPQQTIDQLNAELGGLAISTVLRLVAVLFVSAACFRIIAQAYLGQTTDWRVSLSFAVRRAGPLVGISILYWLGVFGGLVLLVVGSIWLYVAWFFWLPAMFVENLRGPRALGRSFRLVKGRWWRTFGIIVVGSILAAIVSGIVQAVFIVGVVVNSDNNTLVVILSALAGIVGLAVTTPFQAALATVLYFDLRVRKEGYDLELLAREIGAGNGAGDPFGGGADVGGAGDGFGGDFAVERPVATVPAPQFLPPAEPIDRRGAPFWPPPPGWKPPEDP